MQLVNVPKSSVQLDVTTLATLSAPANQPSTPQSIQSYQTLSIQLTRPQVLIHPDILETLELPPTLDLEREVILFGQAPNWLYNALIHQCYAVPWIGCFDARSQQVIIIQSRLTDLQPGDVLRPLQNPQSCPAILIGGPPNSGKSVFANALRRSLIQQFPEQRLFLHRANWDGEGNWAYESANLEFVDQLVQSNEYRIHENPETAKLIPEYFRYHAGVVGNLRKLTDSLLIDVGGKPQPEKQPLIEQCSHYIIISRSPEAIPAWHDLCRSHLKPLAIIHSVLDDCLEIVQSSPVLEFVAGPWVEEHPARVPQILVDAIATMNER